MKLRIRASSLRLRVTRGEVDRLRQGSPIVELVPFGTTSLRYALRVAAVPAMKARFEAGCIEVEVPTELARTWLDTEQVGLAAEQQVGDGGPLQILLEKDFACLKPREGEDDGDAFPNPAGS